MKHFWGPAHCAEAHCGRCLVREIEAFLSARAADDLAQRGAEIPPWAWLNRLAHAPAADVLARAGRRGARSWDTLLAFLAHEIWATAEGDAYAIEDIQHDVLVPLELSIVDDTTMTAPQLARMVVHALDAHKEAHRPQR